jgi:hypothetical protein
MAGFISASDVGGGSFGSGQMSSAQSSGGGVGMAGAAGAISSIASSVSSIMAGRAAKAVAKYNQTLYNIKGDIIEANQKWQKARFAEARKAYMGKGLATLSAQNVGLTSRTSLALLNKSMENLYLDEAISDYNARMSASQARSGAVIAGMEGRAQATSYYVQGASSVAKGMADYASAMYGR